MKALLVTLLKSIFTKSISKLWENKNDILLYLKTIFGTFRNKEIRFSISYLFRIKIPDTNSYLLVLNRRIENQLQPVGGVYKRYGDDKLFEKWEYTPDNQKNGLDVDKESNNDLRFKVRGKYVVEVIKWFEENKEREISCEREFYEELVKTNILDKEVFNQIKYKHIKRVSKNLQWSKHFGCYEVLIYDIMELLPTIEQRDCLIELGKKETDLSNRFAVVKCDDIEQLRIMKNGVQIARIGEHTKLTINKTN